MNTSEFGRLALRTLLSHSISEFRHFSGILLSRTSRQRSYDCEIGLRMVNRTHDVDELLLQATRGDRDAFDEVLSQTRDRLRRMVQFRLDRRLSTRIDPSDVIQEAHLEAFERLPEYLQNPKMSFFLWLRFITGQKLMAIARKHLQVEARDIGREVALYSGALPAVSSAALAAHLAGRQTSPSNAAVRAERTLRIQDALNQLEDVDREVLSLRHFEQLTNSETAQVLDLKESACSKRYVRALRKLRDELAAMPGGIEGIQP